VGIGYTPPLWDPLVIEDIVAVLTESAKAGARVVTLMCDSGLKYVNTDVYRRG
jgi:hypothetical protein